VKKLVGAVVADQIEPRALESLASGIRHGVKCAKRRVACSRDWARGRGWGGASAALRLRECLEVLVQPRLSEPLSLRQRRL
jgi:hypothetical protein